MIAPITFLFIFLASLCNADISEISSIHMRHIDESFDDDSYSAADVPKLDDTSAYGPNAARDFYIVVIFGLFALQLNLFGSLYVIFRTYLQLRRGGRSNVPLSLRFPFYIAMTDALLSLAYTVNLSHTLVWKLPWSSLACVVIGTSVTALFVLNVLLVGIVALTTWSFVCKEYYIDFGPYDYRLWAVALVLSSLVVYFSKDKAGQQKYWCAGRHHSMFVPVALIVFIIVSLVTILVCYIRVLLKIRNNDNLLLHYQRAPIEKRALRKLISYIFIFVLQFIPIIIYNVFMLVGSDNILLDVLAITTINFGGIGNFIQFVVNEGLSYSSKLNSLTSSITSATPRDTIAIKVTMHEVRDVVIDQSNTDKHKSTSNDNNNDLSSSENDDVTGESNIDEINIDYTDEINNRNDTLTTLDATTLISANSSKNLLNNDDGNFEQELGD